MKKIVLLTIVSFLFLTSCIELEETVYLKKNGSGTYTVSLNLSQLRWFLNQSDPSSENKVENNFSKLHQSLDSLKYVLTSFAGEGIDNLHLIEDTVQYIFGISFDFNNVDALNHAMANMQRMAKLTSESNQAYVFQYTKKIFQRFEVPSLLLESITSKLSKDNSDSSGVSLLFLNNITYTSAYRFDRKIKKIENTDAILSADGKTVILKRSLYDIVHTKKSIKNKITLK